MKSALIIASVLLVGVALEVAARNVNDNQNQRENSKYLLPIFIHIFSISFSEHFK